MITKFNCEQTHNSIEFSREVDNVLITITEFDLQSEYLDVTLTKENLFSLIGQLLRIQAEIKEEVKNG